MFTKIIYTAKIGIDRVTRETGTILNSANELRVCFDKDIDWSEPVFMIIEPGDNVEVEKDTESFANLDQDISVKWTKPEDLPQRAEDDPVEFGEVPLSRVSPPYGK